MTAPVAFDVRSERVGDRAWRTHVLALPQVLGHGPTRGAARREAGWALYAYVIDRSPAGDRLHARQLFRMLRETGVLDLFVQRIEHVDGPHHARVFSSRVRVATATGLTLDATATGSSATGAKSAAASAAWDQLRVRETPARIRAARTSQTAGPRAEVANG